MTLNVIFSVEFGRGAFVDHGSFLHPSQTCQKPITLVECDTNAHLASAKSNLDVDCHLFNHVTHMVERPLACEFEPTCQ